MAEINAGGIASAVRGLPPGYFALVMATGIISVGLGLLGIASLSVALLWVSIVAYAVLLVLTVWRLIVFRTAFTADLTDAATGFAFFTFVAGTDVLATRLGSDVVIAVPITMLAVSFAAWVVMGYAIPWGVIVVGQRDRGTLHRMNGTWFIWSVASQSLAVLAAGLQPHVGAFAELFSIIAVLSWGIGVALYAAIGVALVIRVLTRGMMPTELGPSYWVTMGAAAITVLAGSRIAEMTQTPMVRAAGALIAGAAVVFWAFASWLIPALIAMGWWRHVVHRIPLRYEAELWSMVFPLGMYAVASMYLGQADRLPIAGAVGAVFIWIALAAWLAVAAAGVMHVATGRARTDADQSPGSQRARRRSMR